ncbi:hypothetical protein D3C81_1914130 [compost metagenome]
MGTQNEKSSDINFEYIYCGLSHSGKRLLDAHAYGLKARRLRVKRRKGGGQ